MTDASQYLALFSRDPTDRRWWYAPREKKHVRYLQGGAIPEATAVLE